MEGYRLFRKDKQRRQGGSVSLYVSDQLEHIQFHWGWMKSCLRAQGRATAGNVLILLHMPIQGDGVDGALYRHIAVASHSQALVLMGGFDHPNVCWRDNNIEPHTVGKDQVQDHLRNLKVHKSIGPDDIHLQDSRDLAVGMAKPLFTIFEKSW